MSSLNPEHPVTKEMESQWYKMLAVVMNKLGLKEVEIFSEDIERLSQSYQNPVIVCNSKKDRIVLTLMPEREARLKMVQ